MPELAIRASIALRCSAGPANCPTGGEHSNPNSSHFAGPFPLGQPSVILNIQTMAERRSAKFRRA